ncbi:MAG: transposase [bacterium]|nr:transposase [bacterium]
MSARSASCGRRSASWSWSSTREKRWTPAPPNPTKPSDGAGPQAGRRPPRVDHAALPLVRRAAVDLLLPPAPAAAPAAPVVDREVEATIRAIIEAEPAAGLRMITARVRRAAATPVNPKKIHRILRLNQWQVRQRPPGHRPRAQGWVSRATRPNERWAIDTTHLFCGRDGWCHLTAIIDCYDRTIVGGRLSRSGIAAVAAAALEEALRARRIDATSPGLVLRSDNGLVFGAKVFVAVARRYRLSQEYITPDTPQQHGMIERFFLTLKQACVWLQRFASRDHAFRVVADWLDRFVGFGGAGVQRFSRVELQDQLADLRPQLADLALMDRLLVVRPRLEPARAGLEEQRHPALDLGLREIVLPAGVDERRLPLDQLQQQLDLAARRPPLKLLLHRRSL